jgi:hypothetical protein
MSISFGVNIRNVCIILLWGYILRERFLLLASQKTTTFRLKPLFRIPPIRRKGRNISIHFAAFFNRPHCCVLQSNTTEHTNLTILLGGGGSDFHHIFPLLLHVHIILYILHHTIVVLHSTCLVSRQNLCIPTHHTSGVTLLLHCCYTVVTLLLHCCYTVVTLLLHCCYTVVTLFLHCCYTVVTLLLHCCYTVVTLFLHCCYTVVTLFLHCSYTVLTLLLHCCYTVVTLL